MARQRKKFSDLQKIVLRLGLFQFGPDKQVDVCYPEVLTNMGWRSEDVEDCTAQYGRALVDLDRECSVLEADGILIRVKDGNGLIIGVKLTPFGVALALRTRSVMVKLRGIVPSEVLKSAFIVSPMD